ncbi:MAG: hypothetical protein ACR2QC_01480 [Gammaproteobacteria bacterium]
MTTQQHDLDHELQAAIYTYLDACTLVHRANVEACRVAGRAFSGNPDVEVDKTKETVFLDTEAKTFRASFSLHVGRNYVRINCGKQIFGYVAHSDTKRVRRGFLLKAGARGPALNVARGNVLTGQYKPTGICIS